jgi:hypothetical protein
VFGLFLFSTIIFVAKISFMTHSGPAAPETFQPPPRPTSVTPTKPDALVLAKLGQNQAEKPT